MFQHLCSTLPNVCRNKIFINHPGFLNRISSVHLIDYIYNSNNQIAADLNFIPMKFSKGISILFCCILMCQLTFAQQLKTSEKRAFRHIEDSMQPIALNILQGSSTEMIIQSDSLFTKMLVRALKKNNSFYYPFDSLFTISIQCAPDSSFRIFSWQVAVNESSIRQHGAIQMNTTDGHLQLIPLIDKSDYITNTEDTITDNTAWIGAIYYNMVMHEYNTVKYYTLLGFDGNSMSSNKKYIEVMHFENGRPVFGGAHFMIPNDNLQPKNPARFVMEYKKDAGPKLNYDKELQIIVMEHLISESNEPSKKYTLIGDGDYEGFKWLNGKWTYINKVFNEVTPEGQAPVPTPIRDEDGKMDDNKLKGRSAEKEKQKP